MNRDLHQLEVKDGHIFLDGIMLKGITYFNLVHEEGRMFPELTLKMDVRTLPRSTTKNTDGREGESSKEVLEKTRKKKRLCPACFVGLPEKANYCPACGKCMKYPVELPGIIGRKISPYIRAVAIADRAIHIED